MFGKVQLTSFVFTALVLSNGAVARPHRFAAPGDPTVSQRDLTQKEVLATRSGAAAKIGKDIVGFVPNAVSSADRQVKAAHGQAARNAHGPSPFSKPAGQVGYAGSSHHSSSSTHKKRELEDALIELFSRAQYSSSTPPKKGRAFEDDLTELLARSGAAAKIGKDVVGFVPNAVSSADRQVKAAHGQAARNAHGPSPFSKPAGQVGYAGSTHYSSSTGHKKRDFEDELIALLARSGAAAKIGKDVVGFVPNAVSSADRQVKAAHGQAARNAHGPSPFSKPAGQVGYAGSSHRSSSSSQKKRDLVGALADYLEARSMEVEEFEARSLEFDELDELE